LQALSKKSTKDHTAATQSQVVASYKSRIVSVRANSGVEAVTVEPSPEISWIPDQDLESLLLMHYLDEVFPLQFPFYNPPIAEGGRGWILGLLKQTKPVHDAALSLAAGHRQSILKETGSSISDPGVQQRMYALSLRGLRDHVEVLRLQQPGIGSLKDSIEIFACIIQLILLDVGYMQPQNPMHFYVLTSFRRIRFLKEAARIG
jgi:hypothetical protein